MVDGLLGARRGLLVVGALIGPEERADARHLAKTLGWPVRVRVKSISRLCALGAPIFSRLGLWLLCVGKMWWWWWSPVDETWYL